MAARSISAKQREWLALQLDVWHGSNIISADQSTRILDLYDSPAELAERGRSALLLALMGVAALLIGLAVLLLIGYNWQAMPAAVKLLLIFTVLLATYALAFHLRFGKDRRLLSEIAFCLGCLFFGAAIFLISQIFHMGGHYPDAVWWWALGVLPFALCLESVLLHVLLVAILAIWCGMEVLGFADLGMWFWGRWGFLPNGAYTLPVLAAPGLVWAYRRSSLVGAWLYVALVAWWTLIQPFAWRIPELSPFFIGAVAGLMLLIAAGHPRGSRMAAPFRDLGSLMMAGVLLGLSFHEMSREIFEFSRRHSYSYREGVDLRLQPFLGLAGSWALFAVVAIASLGVLYVASKFEPAGASQPPSPLAAMVQTARRQLLPIAIIGLMLLLFVWWVVAAGPLLPTVLANVAMVAFGFWLINVGLREDDGRTFAAGVGYLLLWAVVRYIDLFGEFGGMLGAAGIFLVCGVALFVVAWFWRHRKAAHYG